MPAHRFLGPTLIAGALLLSIGAPAAQANGFWDSVGGSVVGTVVGNAISNQITAPQPKRVYVQPQRVYVEPRPQVNYAQRAQTARVQTALNYFGFPAGPSDGVMGRGSRAAAANYQAYMGYPATGYLADTEIGTLLGAYDWALAGGPAVTQAVAAGQGGPGLLLAYRQMAAGAPMAPAAAPVAPATVPAVAPATVPAVVPAAVVPAVVPAAVVPAANPPAAPSAAGTSGTGLPAFIPGQPSVNSMNATCAQVAVKTNAEGGPVRIVDDQTIDVDRMLSEQFCLARGYAMAQGESLAATAQGFTAAQIEQQCLAFAPNMADYIGRLNWSNVDDMAKDLRRFVAGTGMAPAQLSANARICLGVGYRLDNPNLALASALVLVGLDEDAYAELIGHQMIEGFGTPARRGYGLDWIDYAVEALQGGATPLVPRDGNDRLSLLEAAFVSEHLDDISKGLAPAATDAPAQAPRKQEAKMLMPGAQPAAPNPPAN